MEQQDKFYDQDGIVVRVTKPWDIAYLKDHLRQCDVDEVWASKHHTPEDALKSSQESAVLSLTIIKEVPIGIFGISPRSFIGAKASVWFLATDDLDKIGRRFAKHSRHFIDMMLGYYPYLFNFVDDRNEKSIKWLKMCGATIEDPKPYGPDNTPFRFFYFYRGDDHV